MNKIKVQIKAHARWEEEFMNSNLNWSLIHVLPFKCTIDTKLRNFQYKFLMRIIPTNKFLLKCRKIASNLCDFCNQHIETQSHLFYDCYHVQLFWNQLNTFLADKEINIDLSKERIFFGILDKDYILVNYILICAKHYIFCCKFKLITPTFIAFKNILKQKEEVEKIIALNNNSFSKHKEKWSKLYPL